MFHLSKPREEALDQECYHIALMAIFCVNLPYSTTALLVVNNIKHWVGLGELYSQRNDLVHSDWSTHMIQIGDVIPHFDMKKETRFITGIYTSYKFNARCMVKREHLVLGSLILKHTRLVSSKCTTVHLVTPSHFYEMIKRYGWR